MSRSFPIAALALLIFATIMSGQQTQTTAPQTGQPAQPTSSVYGRMRRIPPAQGQQPATEAQLPSPAQQFPPDQAEPVTPAPGQRTPVRFPHPTAPSEQVNQQPQPAGPQAQQPKATTPTPATPTPAVQPAPQPSGAEQLPANPPRVSFVGGLLTVAAENSTLSDILKSIESVTHASLEGTQPDQERVFGQFGPGTPRQVLNSILSGSRYDFILVGAVDDPGSVERIMLSQHGTAPAVRSGAQMAARQNTPPRNPDEEEETNDIAEQPQIQQQAPPPPPVPSEQVQPPAAGQQQQVKTPEQLLQELQRLRQQQQQQTSPATGNNPR